MKKKLTPFEAAVDLVKVYALRGDDVNQFKQGGLGSYNGDYSASVGGYMWPIEYLRGEITLAEAKGKKLDNTKILVEQVNGEPVNEIFDLYKIWNYILIGTKQKSLF